MLAALEALRQRLPVTAQAVRNGLAMVELPGRFQIVPGQPALVLDVAHNPHAVAALAANLDAMGFYPTTHAVFGAMADKDLAPMLAQDRAADRPLVLHRPAHAARRDGGRSAGAVAGAEQARRRAREHPCRPHGGPARGHGRADPADRIVVFGSFFTVGGVLEHGVPRLQAKHLAS